MANIRRYAASGTNNASAAKGTSENPYTESEFESMCDEGTWSGGYVEGMGYVATSVTIISSSHSSDSNNPSETSFGIFTIPDPFFPNSPLEPSNHNCSYPINNESTHHHSSSFVYPQGVRNFHDTAFLYAVYENVGVQATFSFNYYVRISGYYMTIGVEVLPQNFEGKIYWAKICVNADGAHRLLPILRESAYLTTTGNQIIGNCTVDLPLSGNVSIELIIGFNFNSGAGNFSTSYTKKIYPFGK